MRTKALDEGNCAAARPGGFRGEADKTGREASRNKKLESKRRAHEQNPPRSSGVPKTGPATVEQPISPASRRPAGNTFRINRDGHSSPGLPAGRSLGGGSFNKGRVPATAAHNSPGSANCFSSWGNHASTTVNYPVVSLRTKRLEETTVHFDSVLYEGAAPRHNADHTPTTRSTERKYSGIFN